MQVDAIPIQRFMIICMMYMTNQDWSILIIIYMFHHVSIIYSSIWVSLEIGCPETLKVLNCIRCGGWSRTRHCGERLLAAGDVDQSGAGAEPRSRIRRQQDMATMATTVTVDWHSLIYVWHHFGMILLMNLWNNQRLSICDPWEMCWDLFWFEICFCWSINSAIQLLPATASGLLPHPLLGRFGRHLSLCKAITCHTWHTWRIWHTWLHM